MTAQIISINGAMTPKGAGVIALPDGLSHRPPMKSRDPHAAPWCEIAAAYHMAQACTPGQPGPSYRELAAMFEWGSVGRKSVRALAEKLGLEAVWLRDRLKTVWVIKNPTKNTTKPSNDAGLVPAKNPTKNPTLTKTPAEGPGNGPNHPEKPNKKPNKTGDLCGFEASEKPNKKPNPDKNENQAASKNPTKSSNGAGLRVPKNPTPSRVRAEERLGVGIGVKNKNLFPNPDPNPGVKFSNEEARAVELVMASFARIQTTIPERFVRDWIGRLGIDEFTAVWDRLRVCAAARNVENPAQLVFAAVKAAQAGRSGWVRNARPGFTLNPELDWMQHIERDWSNPQGELFTERDQCQPRTLETKIQEWAKLRGVEFLISDNRAATEAAAWAALSKKLGSQEAAVEWQEAAEDYEIALRGITDEQARREIITAAVLEINRYPRGI